MKGITMTKKILSIILCALMLFSFSSCSLRVEKPQDPSSDGVSRDSVSATDDGNKVPAGADTDKENGTSEGTSDTESNNSTENSGTTGKENSPRPDGLYFPTDFSFLDGIDKNAHFSDKAPKDPAGDWYPGKTTRDLTTGEVKYNWDRAADTLALIDKYDAIYRGNKAEKVVYLTFDCGYEYRTAEGKYSVGVTNVILDVLKEKNVPGTFFVTGDYLKTDIDIVRRMLNEGHIVGNHTMHHPRMTQVTAEEFVKEIKDSNDLLKSQIPSAPDMIFYRPPGGAANEWTLALAHEMGLKTTFWSSTEPDFDPANQPDPVVTLNNDKVKLHNGCVYLLHAVSITNAEILGELIDYIRAEGYEIRPLSEFAR